MNDDIVMDRLRAARPATGHPAGKPAQEPTDHEGLFARIVAAPGDPRLSAGGHSRRGRAAIKRPRVLAGGSLGLAGVAAGLLLALGGSTPAFAVTREADGTVLVSVTSRQGVIPADAKLESLGIREEVNYSTAPGSATSSKPVACESVAGPGLVATADGSGYQAAAPTGAPVEMRLGSDNTAVIPSGQTGAGTVHLVSCVYYPYGAGTQVGNSGQAFLNANGIG